MHYCSNRVSSKLWFNQPKKLYKIFKLEAELNYQNRAVVGGLEQYTDSWMGEARAVGMNEALIQQVSKIMKNYPNLPIEQRAGALKEIGQILDVAGIKHLPDSPEIQVQAMENQKQEAQKPAPKKPTEKKIPRDNHPPPKARRPRCPSQTPSRVCEQRPRSSAVSAINKLNCCQNWA